MKVLTALLSILASVVTAAPALALCGPPLDFHVLPEAGAMVPRNTRVWFAVFDGEPTSSTYRWRDSEGVSVAFSERRLSVAGSQDLVVLSPEAPLRFPATYQVEVCSQQDGGEKCVLSTTFSTLDEIDEEPPALPEAKEWMRSADDGDYGEQRIVYFSVQGEALVLADANGQGQDSPLQDEGAELAALTVRRHIGIGYGACTRRNIKGDRANVRFGTYDLAGNFSGFTKTQRVHLPELDGCALGAQQGRGWLALLALAGLLSRRRRHACG